MFNILSSIETLYNEPAPIKVERRFSHSPSSAMCYSATDNRPIGSCIRASYMRAKDYPSSNKGSMYMTMTQEAGHLWEDWCVQKFKELGIYISHHSKVADLENNISGELDIVHINPNTGELEVTDIKQYNGSNWYASKEIIGSKDTSPKPKDSHLLQMFVYLLTLSKTGNEHIKYCNILYIDRSCGSWSNNFQFRISLHEEDKVIYPKVEYFRFDQLESYIDKRITDVNVYKKNKMLENYIEVEQLPPRDYQLTYDFQTVQHLHSIGEISDSAYKKYMSDSTNNPIGHWMCKYCQYGPDLKGFSVCYSVEN